MPNPPAPDSSLPPANRTCPDGFSGESKVRIIKRSLLCYNLSWFSLIPFLGVVPAFLVIHLQTKISRETGSNWNPARPYVVRGVTLALFGLVLSLGFWSIFLYQVRSVLHYG